MSTAEPACYSTPEESGLRVESLSFETSRNNRVCFSTTCAIRSRSASFIHQPSGFIMNCRRARRKFSRPIKPIATQLCDALLDMNAAWGAGEATIKNIELLRDADCLAAVSGQQAGLFTGPLYTIYKALSAVKLAGCLTQRNTKTVPVFWIATRTTTFLKSPRLNSSVAIAASRTSRSRQELHREGQPVGRVVINDSINTVVDQLLELLPVSEFTSDLEALVRDAWRSGAFLWRSFCPHDDGVVRQSWIDISRSARSAAEETGGALVFAGSNACSRDCHGHRNAQPEIGGGGLSRAGDAFRKLVSAFPA